MNKEIPEDIADIIDDYILGLLSSDDTKKIKSIINENKSYKKYYSEQKDLIELSQPNDIPDPGSEFWNKFPQQVMNTCQSHDVKPEYSLLDKASSWWRDLPLHLQILSPALTLGIVLSISTFMNQTNESYKSSTLAQQNTIWNNVRIDDSTLDSFNKVKSNSYGFSNSDNLNFFNIGQDFSLSIAYLYNNKLLESKKKLESLMLLNVNEILSQLNAKNSLPTTDIESYLSLYKKIDISLEKSLTKDDYIIFNLGSWIINLKLAIATNNFKLLRKMQYDLPLLIDLKNQRIPISVFNNIELLNTLSLNENHSNKDILKIKKTISDIENTLN